MPILSVIVPVYKGEATLRRCAHSILSQSFSDLELLLVEDGSPDGSGALCDALAGEDHRVRVFHKPNGGVSSARNLGLQKAQGDYIAFADADDWWEPGAFQALYDALISAGADTAGCGHYNVSPSGERRAEAGAMAAGVYGQSEIQAGILDRLVGYRLEEPGRPVLNGFIWRFFFSRQLIAQHQIAFEGAYLEDELFLLEYFRFAQRLAMVDAPLYCYFLNPDSVTHRYLPNYLDTFFRFMERKRELVEKFGLAVPDWEANSLWAGLLIAISNEYAPGNPAPRAEKTRRVASFLSLPQVAQAVKDYAPKLANRNKRLVAGLVRRGQFGLLTLLYTVKNRGN
jgi:glycosyltransferase EpsJ